MRQVDCINTDELENFIDSIHLGEHMFINPSELIFEENVKMNCYYCGKYNNNWRCPPRLPDVDFKKMMTEYESGIFVWNRYIIRDGDDYNKIRNDSSVILHKTLLKIERWLWKREVQ